MVIRCSNCNSQLEIIGYNGSALSTKCPNCKTESHPISIKPKAVISEDKRFPKKTISQVRRYAIPVEFKKKFKFK